MEKQKGIGQLYMFFHIILCTIRSYFIWSNLYLDLPNEIKKLAKVRRKKVFVRLLKNTKEGNKKGSTKNIDCQHENCVGGFCFLIHDRVKICRHKKNIEVF